LSGRRGEDLKRNSAASKKWGIASGKLEELACPAFRNAKQILRTTLN